MPQRKVEAVSRISRLRQLLRCQYTFARLIFRRIHRWHIAIICRCRIIAIGTGRRRRRLQTSKLQPRSFSNEIVQRPAHGPEPRRPGQSRHGNAIPHVDEHLGPSEGVQRLGHANQLVRVVVGRGAVVRLRLRCFLRAYHRHDEGTEDRRRRPLSYWFLVVVVAVLFRNDVFVLRRGFLLLLCRHCRTLSFSSFHGTGGAVPRRDDEVSHPTLRMQKRRRLGRHLKIRPVGIGVRDASSKVPQGREVLLLQAHVANNAFHIIIVVVIVLSKSIPSDGNILGIITETITDGIHGIPGTQCAQSPHAPHDSPDDIPGGGIRQILLAVETEEIAAGGVHARADDGFGDARYGEVGLSGDAEVGGGGGAEHVGM
mmetsp:Transcript_39615/g.85478  ORF Transcript_39615/g.85478 Transcript_39615/m.85478 type:complete len:370 (-) Transcript_39615:1085-2194(-)